MSDDSLTIETQVRGVTAQVALDGACDMVGATQLRRAVDELRNHGIRHLVVDLRGLDFLDSTGLHTLMELDATARANGHNVTVVRPPERVARTFHLVGLDQHFVWVDDPDELAPPTS